MNEDPIFDDELDLDFDMESEKQEEEPAVSPKDLTILQLVERIITKVEGSALKPSVLQEASPFIDELGARLSLTSMQTVFMSILVNMADDFNIQVSDLAHFLKCKAVRVQTYWPDIMELAKKRLIYVIAKNGERVRIVVSTKAMSAFRNNESFTVSEISNLQIDDWIAKVADLVDEKESGITDYELFVAELRRLISLNSQLAIVQNISRHSLSDESLVVLFRTIINFLQDNDDHITLSDIANLMESRPMARRLFRSLSAGNQELFKEGLIEHQNENGQATPQYWHLTSKAEEELLSELKLLPKSTPARGLIASSSLTPKTLFFNEVIQDSIDQLRTLLLPERYDSIHRQLKEHGMRQGIACLFYGVPGTGKTESVYQLARETGRDILPVDIPSLRSKWVGESEKNIKAIFDQYRMMVQRNELAPILLFNEADGVLGRRNTNSTGSVDKMENAMQNIILQEMENLDGIMIATTNLTCNLDEAFDRRFLYKIEFTKPTPKERQHIWQSMLPEIDDDQALQLASKYDFSGGQIENIARKQIVNAILFGDGHSPFEQILKACNAETVRRDSARKPIGF